MKWAVRKGLLFKQLVNAFHLVEGFVEEELEGGDDAQLFPDASAEESAQVTAHLVDLFHDVGLRLVRRAENAQMNAGVRHVGSDVDLCHCDHYVAIRLDISLKYLTKFLLD